MCAAGLPEQWLFISQLIVVREIKDSWLIQPSCLKQNDFLLDITRVAQRDDLQ